MQLKYGSYAFPANGVLISTRIEALRNDGNQIYAYKHLWDVEGWLAASGQAALTAAQSSLVVALQRQRQDLIFYHDDGSESATTLKNANSITGVIITNGPHFGSTKGNEYATERHFAFGAEAEYAVANGGQLLLDWVEDVNVSGGGPVYIHLPAINGPAQKQLLYQQMPYQATQSGSARGYRQFPTPPAPLWPAALKKAPDIRRTSPKKRGPGKFEGFAITWHYEFESVAPLVGLPHSWPGG